LTLRERERRSLQRSGPLAFLAAAAALGAGCGTPPGDRAPAAERPAVARDESFDPQAPGLTDLARLSRYVFREMRRRGEECAPDPAPAGRVDYTLELEVASGRIRAARLATVSAELGGFTAPLLPERWPPGLVASIECLAPHLKALPMPTAPADGVYESRFSMGESPAPPQAAPAADAESLPDPAEPGLPDLQRLARHVFVEMHRIADSCALRNPLAERLGYVVQVEVRAGTIRSAEITSAHVELADGTLPLVRDAWPEALQRYASCLRPHLEGLRLEPAPADGVYRPDYAVQPEP